MVLRPPGSTRTYTLFPSTTLFRSGEGAGEPLFCDVACLLGGEGRTAGVTVRSERASPVRGNGTIRWVREQPPGGARRTARRQPIETGRAGGGGHSNRVTIV